MLILIICYDCLSNMFLNITLLTCELIASENYLLGRENCVIRYKNYPEIYRKMGCRKRNFVFENTSVNLENILVSEH